MGVCMVGDYLLRRLREVGVRHVFGVPGDYQLEFLDQVEAMDGLDWVGNCNELNAAYAADGYGRLNGIAALVTTFGVGELSALNGVAGAYAESVPVVSIVGTPATFVMEGKQKVHHTAGDGDFTRAAKCAGEYTVAQAMLTRDNAASEIDRVLRFCWLLKRPVYIMLPSDVAYETVEAPTEPLALLEPSSDPRRLEKFAGQSRDALRAARSVAVLVGPEADRYHLAGQLVELVEKIGCPVACLSNAKGVFPEDHDQFIGGYAGKLSDTYVRESIENADCLLAVGTQFTDSVTGGFSQNIDPSRVIALHPSTVAVGETQHAHVSMKDALLALISKGPHKPADITSLFQRRLMGQAYEPVRSARLVQERFWPQLQAFLEPGDVVIADQGTSYYGCAELPLPHGCTFVGQPLWGSIGYTLPALLGTMLAAPDRRHILLIGDGSFQLTAQELSTVLRKGLTPVIILVNNDGYTVERCILGADASYNNIATWRYDRLVEAFDPRNLAITAKADTEDALAAALDTARSNRDRLVFIEAVMERLDAPESLVKLGKAFAAADYHHAPVS
ncbi:alpha-keto acid decarboxylase family protein [Streptomyces sp. NEAU-YJ-81]|uniref:alpha-keto acid decarboxylase family protein n=1 Tax=Streptomyces sp. NEAU-YJ-81 TaxID=2820288 RepID=UPI001ABC916E|nr:alpha-keto acid decarboxylase family protein [Streptomyces sp. NEAU-YJ-81]MBO3675616.1 alpha-keto acid decarboxylase family protein [Streptomyces sp. NEAU-YJ-81]